MKFSRGLLLEADTTKKLADIIINIKESLKRTLFKAAGIIIITHP